jgi:transcriptional regulator with XRE-family HTH domain
MTQSVEIQIPDTSKAWLLAEIQSRLASLQERNPGFSLRAYSRKLGVPAPVLSELLRGKRNLTKKMALRLVERLELPPEDTRRVLESVPTRRVLTGDLATSDPWDSDFVQLQSDTFHLVSDWWHFAILSLAETRGFRSDAPWIARRLGISVSQVEGAVETLLRLGMLKQRKAPMGQIRWVPTGVQFTTESPVPSVAIRKFHRVGCAQAEAALELANELRDFGASIIAGNPDRLPKVKAMLNRFRRQIAGVLEGGTKSEVYRLNIQLFPLSRNEVGQ